MQEAQKLREKLMELQENALKFKKSQGDGFSKYLSIIKAEIKNLKILEKKEINLKDLQGCNYYHLQGIFDTFLHIPNAQIFKKFKFNNTSIRVDVSTKTSWVKVNARARYPAQDEGVESDSDSDSEEDEEFVDSKYCQKLATIDSKFIKHAKSLVEASKANPTLMFTAPIIIYQFVRLESSLPACLEDSLKDLGIVVYQDFKKLPDEENNIQVSTPVVNLDVTSMVAMVSEMTYFPIDAEVVKGCLPLELQKINQDSEPLLPYLNSIFCGKILVCTMAAFKVFKNIIETIGGEHELFRAVAMFNDTDSLLNDELLNGLSVVHPQPKLDMARSSPISCPPWKILVIENNPSNHIKSLSRAIKLSELHVNVFGTGDQKKLTTITANGKIQRTLDKAAEKEHPIIVHSVRGLVEQRVHKLRNAT